MTGSDKIRVDDKGRLAFPSRFRDCLQSGGNWYLTGHPHGCLALYSEARFQKIVKHFEESPNMSYFDSHLEEVIVGSAEFMQLDSAGRILIPNHLRERAVIKRDVLLFVMSGRMRIWDEERWEQRNQVMEARLQDEEFSQQWRNLNI
ncbi:MAG: hypothetical protein R1F54_00540 [Candidatus Zeuxoniibacter abyssi]|nr:MAG: hypothetical protein R1F54_00540 [Candidatus Persebacteraceae bacterium AB1(2)]